MTHEVQSQDTALTISLTTFPAVSATNLDPTQSSRGKLVETDLSGLARLVTEAGWSPSVFADNHRKSANFLETQLIGLDFDGEHDDEGQLIGAVSVEEAKEVFGPFLGLIGTSKSHMIPKPSGKKTKEACPRFRVVLVLSRPICSEQEFLEFRKGFQDEVIEKRLSSQDDEKCRFDVARFYFPCSASPTILEGSPVDVDYFVSIGAFSMGPREETATVVGAGSDFSLDVSRQGANLSPTISESHPLVGIAKARSKLSDILALYGVRRVGNRHAPCFACGVDQENPSLQLTENFAYCHRCERPYDAIDVVRHFEKCRFSEALAKMTITIPLRLQGIEPQPPTPRQNLTRIMQERAEENFARTAGVLVQTSFVVEEQSGLLLNTMQSLIVKDIEKESSRLLVDPFHGSIRIIDTKSLEAVFPRKFKNDDGDEVSPFHIYRTGAERVCTLTYDPFAGGLFFLRNGELLLNQYVPPPWQRASFLFGKPIQKVAVIPLGIERFLRFFTNGDHDSYEYVQDWLAQAVQKRNQTYLTAVGIEGNGKGTFGEILSKIFGEKNYVKVRDTVLKEKFNGQIENRRLIFIDEIFLKNKEHFDRLKDFVNHQVEVEKKGQDACSRENFASIFISSNNMDCLPIHRESRRFSIIVLAQTKMKDYFDDIDSLRNELLSYEAINDFACYLFHREVMRDMLTPFVSSRFEEMIEATCAEWEKYLLWDAPIKENVTLKEVQDLVKIQGGASKAPGRDKLRELAKKFPDRILVEGSNANVRISLKGDGRPERLATRSYEPPLLNDCW